MALKIIKSLDLKFPQGEHENCQKLTEITAAHLPADGSLGKLLRRARRTFIWQPGDRSDKIYFLTAGRVGISGIDRDGREVLVAMIAAGEPFGELCFCGGPTEERSTTATALADCAVLEITLEDFVAFLQRDAQILGKFLFTFCVKLAHAERRIVILALRRVEERLGYTLLHLAQTRGLPVNERIAPQEFRLSIKHEELSALTALSRQRVTVVMNQFRRLGLINYSRTAPLVVNAPALAKYLDELGG